MSDPPSSPWLEPPERGAGDRSTGRSGVGSECLVCGTPVGPPLLRCPACGLHLPGPPPRQGSVDRNAVALLLGLFVAVYAFTFLIVAIAS